MYTVNFLFFISLLNAACKESLLVSAVQKCLTWDLYNDDSIQFICRVPSFSKSISLMDNHGIDFAQCTFFDNHKTCHPSENNNFVRVNYTTNEVVFYVERENLWQYNGEWSCRIGREILTSIVSVSKGIINETNVSLESTPTSTSMIALTCSSCKEPVSHNAEFHINGRSEISVTYDKGTGKCMHFSVHCKSGVCGCSASGNEFSALFHMNASINSSFSCDMMFSDPITSAKFSKLATIKFNGTDYIQMETQTKVIKNGTRMVKHISHPGKLWTTTEDVQGNTNDEYGKNHQGHPLQWFAIVSLVVIISLLVVVFMTRKCKKRIKRNLPEQNEENIDVKLTAETRLLDDNDDNDRITVGTEMASGFPEDFQEQKDLYGGRQHEVTAKSFLLDKKQCTMNSQATMTDGVDTTQDETPNQKDEMESMPIGTYISGNMCTVIDVYNRTGLEYQCEPCEKQGKRTMACVYCTNCNEQYCLLCRKYHLSMKMTSSHVLIEIGAMFCDLHGKSEFTHICYPHKMLICNQCLNIRHQLCNADLINSIKTSNDSIQLEYIDMLKRNTSLNVSTPNLSELVNSGTNHTAKKQLQPVLEKNYFQKCINAVDMLRKEEAHPKSRISFKTKDMESRFLPRKKDEFDLVNTV